MMKKNLLTRGMSVVLASVMALSLAACGSTNQQEETTGKISAILDISKLSGTMDLVAGNYKGLLGYGYSLAEGSLTDDTGINRQAPVVDSSLLASMSKLYTKEANELENNYYKGLNYSKFTGTGGKAKTKSYKELMTSATSFKTQRELINADSMTLAQCLSAQFLKDIEDGMSAADMLDKYGEYVLTDIYMGGVCYTSYYLADDSENSIKEAENMAMTVNEELGLANARVIDDAAATDIKSRVRDFDAQSVVSDGKTYLQFMEEYSGAYTYFYGGTKKTVRKNNIFEAIEKIPSWIDTLRAGKYQKLVQVNSTVAIWEVLEASMNNDVKAMGAAMKQEYDKRIENGNLQVSAQAAWTMASGHLIK